MAQERNLHAVHPLFPTVIEAKKQPQRVFSDHLPILLKAPIGTSSLNIISINVLGPSSAANGFYKTRGWETDEEARNRYRNIVCGLMKGISKHNVDVLALQEASPDFLMAILNELLPDGWQAVPNEVGIITCFNSNRLILKQHTPDYQRRISTFKFIDTQNNESITLHNVWGIYDPFPHRMELFFRKLLAQDKHNILVGDTNSRIAPIDNKLSNITTCIVPIGMNEIYGAGQNYQITDHPDGGFYANHQSKIHQLTNEFIDYISANIVVDERNINELQLWPEFRMLLCLDDYYQNYNIVNGQTIFEYENYLINNLHENVIVRMAANCKNLKALGIRFQPKSPLYEYLKNNLKVPGFQARYIDSSNLEDGGIPYPTLFVPQQYMSTLSEVVRDFQSKYFASVGSIQQTEGLQMNMKLFEAVRDGNLALLKEYCNHGANQEKLIEIMTLGIDPDTKNSGGKTAVMVCAKNNKPDVLHFIIDNALKDQSTRALLARQLIGRTPEGRNPLHEAAVIPESDKSLRLLSMAAKQLFEMGEKSLANYLNTADEAYGSTPLHYTVRQGNFSNYVTLIEMSADKNAKTQAGLQPIDLLCFTVPEKGRTFMHEWLRNTEEGLQYFKKRYGRDSKEVDDKVLDILINIDLDTRLINHSKAQLNAIKVIVNSLPTIAKESPKDILNIISNVGYVDFNAIDIRDLTDDDSVISSVIQNALEKAASIEDNVTKNIFIRAEVLRHLYTKQHKNIKGLQQVNQEVFDYYGYGELLNKYPRLALDGIIKVDKEGLNPFVVAKRIAVAMVRIQLADIPQKSTKPLFPFMSNPNAVANMQLNKFLVDMHNVSSIKEIYSLVQQLGNNQKMEPIKNDILQALKKEGLIPEQPKVGLSGNKE